jgi:hypothetical protein
VKRCVDDELCLIAWWLFAHLGAKSLCSCGLVHRLMVGATIQAERDTRI